MMFFLENGLPELGTTGFQLLQRTFFKRKSFVARPLFGGGGKQNNIVII